MKKTFLLSLILVLCTGVIAVAEINTGSQAPMAQEKPVAVQAIEKPEPAAVTINGNTAPYDVAAQDNSTSEISRPATAAFDANSQAKFDAAKDMNAEPVPGDPNVILQGGDTFANATAIPSLPYTDNGTTVGYTHDYSGSCIYSSAPDVVYSYTPTADGGISVSLCPGYGWDTGLIVFANDISTEVGCNDDFCGTVSEIENIPVTVGNTYYIVVTGYSTYSGDYTLVVEPYVPCVVTCPPGGVPEGEVDCYDEYVDATNGGCNSTPYVFGTYNWGDMVCGTYGTYLFTGNNYRDTDWYRVVLPGPGTITWKVVGEGPTLAYILEDANEDCAFEGTASITAAACDTAVVTYTSYAGGVCYLFAAPSVFSGVACGSQYVAYGTFEPAAPCVVTCPPGGTPEGEVDCYDEYVDATNGGCNSTPNVFGTIGSGETVCGTSGTYLFGGSNYRDTDWYEFTLTERKTVTLTGVAEFPFLLFLIAPPCPGSIISQGTALPCSTATTTAVLDPGTYYAFAGPSVFAGVACGSPYYVTLTLTDPPPPPTPDFFVTDSGTWLGNTCGAINNCDLRPSEEHIYEVTITTAGVWTFSLCGVPATWDTYLYLGSTICSSDIAYNDDFCGLVSEISANLVPGVYYLTIEGYSESYCGDYQLDITYAPPPSVDFYVTGEGTWTGNTCGAGNDCALRPSEDHIYEVTIPTDGFWTFSLCNVPATWDTYLYLGTSPCDDNITYNDDFCGLVSQISTNLTAGVYYLTLEGFSSTYCGDYQLDITYIPPIVVTCPPGGILEGEPDCGPGYIDTFNGGCNSAPPAFSSIACGDWVCGKGGTYDSSRDTDWYRLEILEGGDLHFKGIAEFPLQLLIIEALSEDCVTYNIISSGTANQGDTLYVDAFEVNPGIYWMWAGPSVFTGWPCPLDYVINVECDLGTPIFGANPPSVTGQAPPGSSTSEAVTISNTGTRTLNSDVYITIDPPAPLSTLPSNNDPKSAFRAPIFSKPAGSHDVYVPEQGVTLQGGEDIATATVIPSLPYNDAGTTAGYINDYDEICPYDNPGAPDVVYSYTAVVDTIVTITLCNGSAYDTKLYIYENSYTPGFPYACNDDQCPGYVSEIVGLPITGGNTYYIVVDGYSSVDYGAYVLDMFEVEPPPPPPGCPAEGVVFGQNPSLPDGSWTFATSDAEPGYQVFESFSGVFGEITEVHLWGIDAFYSGGWMECSEDPASIQVSFWTDAGGLPGVQTDFFDFSVSPVPTGQTFSGFIQNEFILTLPSPIYVSSGWVSVQGTSAGDNCWFMWQDSPEGDGAAIQFDGTNYTLQAYDMAVCLVGNVITPWLSVDQAYISVPPGGALDVNVTMDAATLAEGTYTGSVWFNANDAGLTLHEVPVNFNVVTGGACNYIPGDINGNGTPNGIDVTYGVIYFKGGNVPPIDCGGICPQTSPFYAAGDVNGNCVFNGIDVTYYVNYLKGIVPSLQFCPTCPPPPAGAITKPGTILKAKAVETQQ